MRYTYLVNAGEPIPILMASQTKKRLFDAKAAAYDLPDKEHLLWSDVISPMRRQYEEAQQNLTHLGAVPGPYTIHWPTESDRLERSGFFKRPIALRASAWVDLSAEVATEITLTLTSASALSVTYNDTQLLHSMTYTRNQSSNHEVTLEVTEIPQRLMITIDEYAERDTEFFLQLHYLQGTAPLRVTVEGEVDAGRIEAAQRFLASISTDRFSYDGRAPITLRIEAPAAEDLELELVSQFTDAHLKRMRIVAPILISAGVKTVDVPNSFSGQVGMAALILTLRIGAVTLSKTLEFEYYDQALLAKPEATIQGRKEQALRFIADHGVDSLPRALAMALLDYPEERWLSIMYDELQRIELRYDCSDFRLCALIWAYRLGSERPLFPPALLARMKEVLLGYRYHQSEVGTDVMWFFSENHAINFHAAQLLASELFVGEIFTNSGRTASEQKERAKELLYQWFDRFFTYGYEEWNSSVYIPIDLIALISLFELSEDQEIRALAKRALDETFSIMAINSYRGVMASTYGRTYFKNLIGRKVGEASAINFIAFGEGYLNHHTYATTLFALSEYEPNDEIVAQYRCPEQRLYETVATVHKIPLQVLKSPAFILASAHYSGPAQAGLQEHMVQLMVGDIDTQIWINHPGEYEPFGSGRPSYFAGNGTIPQVLQEQGRVTLEFDLVFGAVDFTHAYVPLAHFDEVVPGKQRWFLRKGEVYIEIFAENGLTVSTTGPFADTELISEGRKNRWVLEVATQEEVGSFAHFQKM